MPAEQRAIEALNLVGNWSKWLVTVETATIGLVTSLILRLSPNPQKLDASALDAAGLLVICFTLSIIAATALLAALPAMAQRVPERGETPANAALPLDIYLMTAWKWGGPPLQALEGLQSGFFALGILCFLFLVVEQIWQSALLALCIVGAIVVLVLIGLFVLYGQWQRAKDGKPKV